VDELYVDSSSYGKVACPRCGQPAERVQDVQAPFIACFFFIGAWGSERIVGCPRCVQRRLWQLFWISVPLSNIIFPIVWTLLLMRIRASKRNTCPEVPEGFLDRPDLAISTSANPSSQRNKALRLLAIAIILVAVLGVVLLVVPRLAK
jgi:hypothetical protein